MDILIVTVTLALFAWIGFRVRHRDEDLDDYITARGTQTAVPLGLSFFASGMGAWILFAPPEVGAFVGIVSVLGYALGAAGPFLAFALLGRRIRRVIPSGHSLTEFVRLRFGPTFRAAVFAISIMYMFFFVTAELSAVSAVGAITTGLDARLTIVAVAAVTLAYTAYGGLRASLATDRLQAWLVVALLAIGAAGLLLRLDTSGADVSGSGLLSVGRVGVESAITLIIAVTAANLFHQGYWQRVWAASDQRSLVRGAGIGIALTAPVVAFVGILGILAASAGLPLGDPPAPFFALAAGASAWIGYVVLGLGVALVASSLDTLENAIAALAVSERPGMRVDTARLLTIVLVVPAVLVALQGYSVLRLFLVADLLCAATVVPMLLGLWSRATTAGALAGTVAGLLGTVVPSWIASGSLGTAVHLATFPGAVPTLPPFAWALGASTVVAVVVSLATTTSVDLARLDEEVPALTSG
ncbi:MAG: sodium:solute symporter [Actinobacteria bacterium]|nr:sodium:solute symporter [Actinomycetota bacterium]